MSASPWTRHEEVPPPMPELARGDSRGLGRLTRYTNLIRRSLHFKFALARLVSSVLPEFASGIIREPLNGVDAICPVVRATRVWVSSPRTVIANLIVGHEAPAAKFAHPRSINVPGMCVSVGEMVAALRRIAGEEVANRVKWQPDPVIERIVATWPPRFAPVLGPALGMRADSDFDSIARAYMDDELPKK